MSSLKVEVVKIDDIQPHPNADRLDLAQVNEWHCVVQKDSFKKGDLCIYIPIDSMLPQNVTATIFPSDSKVQLKTYQYHGPESMETRARIRTIRLRGAISQGLIIPMDMFPTTSGLSLGTDVAKILGIEKYEPPQKMPRDGTGSLTKSKRISHPHFKKYTSIENWKHYPILFEEGEIVNVTEKIHGTNFRCGWVPYEPISLLDKLLRKLDLFKWLPQFQFVYGSHNVQYRDKNPYTGFYDKNVYSEAVINYDLKNRLPKGWVVYGEIYGDGIQKGYNYDCKAGERKFVAFDLMCNGRYISPSSFRAYCNLWAIPRVPHLGDITYNRERMKAWSDGPSILHAKEKVREGVVIKATIESESSIGRKMLKIINDGYLLKDQSDFH